MCVSVCSVRQTSSPHRDKRGRNGGERPVRSWQGGGTGLNRGGGPPPSSLHPSVHVSSAQRNYPTRPTPPRGRASHLNQMHPPLTHYRENLSNASHGPAREGQDPKPPPEPSDGVRAVGRGREGPPVVNENSPNSQGSLGEQDLHLSTSAAPLESGVAKPASQRQQEQRGSGERAASSDPSPQPSATAANWEASSPAERPVERKSYSLARRTRSRAADLGSKQPSVEEAAVCSTSSPSSAGGKTWSGPSEGLVQASGAGPLAELEQDVARISLAGQSWSQSPASYIRSEMRGELELQRLENPGAVGRSRPCSFISPGISNMHLSGAPPQFSNMEEMGVASSRAKRYSSQRQRGVPEPTPAMHLGVMEGHYYEPSKYTAPL